MREREREEEEEEEEQGPKPYTDRIYQRPEEDCKISDWSHVGVQKISDWSMTLLMHVPLKDTQ